MKIKQWGEEQASEHLLPNLATGGITACEVLSMARTIRVQYDRRCLKQYASHLATMQLQRHMRCGRDKCIWQNLASNQVQQQFYPRCLRQYFCHLETSSPRKQSQYVLYNSRGDYP